MTAEANAGLDLNRYIVRHTTNVDAVFAFGDEDAVAALTPLLFNST